VRIAVEDRTRAGFAGARVHNRAIWLLTPRLTPGANSRTESAIGVPASADGPRPRAAADSAKASTRLSALILAAGQLKTVPGIEKKLKAELDNTVGVKR
jgi:hypothetical protein